MKFEFCQSGCTTLGVVHGTLKITDLDWAEHSHNIQVPYYRYGMTVYVDLRERDGKRLAASSTIRKELAQHVSYELDRFVCYDLGALDAVEKDLAFRARISKACDPVVWRVRNFIWVCFRPVRHFIFPTLRKLHWLVAGPTVYPR